MKRLFWLGFVLFLDLICSGCGETFRPIIIPNPPTFPNPSAAHTVVSINDNGAVVPGSAMVVDVAGDSIDGIKNVGLHPVYAVQQSARSMLVVNQSVAGTAADSVTELSFSGTSVAGVFTITLPVNSAPNFVATTEATQAYVSLPNFFLDPVNYPGDATVAVVNTSTNSTVDNIMVGNSPVAMAETPDGTKLYVANQGGGTISGSISAFNTVDRSARSISGSLTSSPIWLSARSDSQRVFVLESNGTLAFLDTTSTAGPDTLTETSISALGATYMWYDMILNRLYIPGQILVNGISQGAATIVDVSQTAPLQLASLALTPVSPAARAQSDVCSTFNPTAVTATAITSLPDGSRAYASSFASFAVNISISGATVNTTNGTTTYTYSPPASGPDLLAGMVVTITGATPSDFNGTFTVVSVGGGTFQVTSSPTDQYVSGGTGVSANVCPQVTVINATSNSIQTTIGIPGSPDATNPNTPAYLPLCATTRFRFMMAAGGDSSRAYLSSCDAGTVNIIMTATESYLENQVAPASTRQATPPASENAPQNPVFLLAGP